MVKIIVDRQTAVLAVCKLLDLRYLDVLGVIATEPGPELRNPVETEIIFNFEQDNSSGRCSPDVMSQTDDVPIARDAMGRVLKYV